MTKYKVGDYLRIKENANLGSSGFKHGDVKKVVIAEFHKTLRKDVYTFDEKGVDFYNEEVELAEDYILKQLWS